MPINKDLLEQTIQLEAPQVILERLRRRTHKPHFWGDTKYAVTFRKANHLRGKTVCRTNSLKYAKRRLQTYLEQHGEVGDVTTLYIGCPSLPLDYLKAFVKAPNNIQVVTCRKDKMWGVYRKNVVSPLWQDYEPR